MADYNPLEEQTELARFLDKFNQSRPGDDFVPVNALPAAEQSAPIAQRPEQYNNSFERLEEKIHELEEKFEASNAQNQAVLQELSRTRQAVENQKSREAFFANITATIASLKQSVENLSRAQQEKENAYGTLAAYQPDSYRRAHQEQLQAERESKENALLQLQAQQQTAQQAQQALTHARQEAQQVRAELSQAQLRSAQTRQALEKEQENSRQMRRALMQAQASSAQAREELAQEKASSAQIRAELAQTQQSANRTRQELAQEQEAFRQVRQELEQEQSLSAQIREDLAQEQASSSRIREKLVQAQARHQAALQDLDALRNAHVQTQEALEQEKLRADMEEAKWQGEREEKARLISSLQQKAGALKAVNVALDREIKQAQEEKMEALRKSAEQAKEILSLRDALTVAEGKFKSFDFEGRIISVKLEYQQKVNTLEEQLHAISDTCMKQVEEIETLKDENIKLHKIAEEREQLSVLYEAKSRRLARLEEVVLQLRNEHSQESQQRLAEATERMEQMRQQHTELAARLEQTQQTLQAVRQEKQNLEEQFQSLLNKIKQNDGVIEGLKRKIAVLAAENKELKQNSRPLQPVGVRQELAPAATKAAAAAEAEIAAPVQPQQPAKLQSSADLPEIRVTQREEPLVYAGEDFLEKTDSFIGRMKWSLFRDDE